MTTKLKDTQVDLNHFCSHGSVNQSGLTVAGTYYLKICNVDNFFNNYNQRITVDVSFFRGGSHCNALRFDIIRDDQSNFYINQIGGNIFGTLRCITASSVIIGTDGYLYLQAKIAQCDQFACHVNVYTQPSNGDQYKIDISGLSNSNISATAPAIRKELVLTDNCIINSDDLSIKAKAISANSITSEGIEANSFINTVHNSNNDILLGDGSVADKSSFLQKSGDVTISGGLQTTLDSGQTYIYDNVASKYLGNNTVTGTILIDLPNGWNRSMNIYEIELYEYASNTQHYTKIMVSGYNYPGGDGYWYNYSTTIEGGAINKPVRLGYNSATSKCCILIGTTSSYWAYTSVYLTKVLSSVCGSNSWRTGYNISLITDESNITKIVTPPISPKIAGGFIHSTYNSPNYLLTSNGGVLATSSFAPSVSGGYLPLSGGTMSNTNLVSNLNAQYLSGLDKYKFPLKFENAIKNGWQDGGRNIALALAENYYENSLINVPFSSVKVEISDDGTTWTETTNELYKYVLRNNASCISTIDNKLWYRYTFNYINSYFRGVYRGIFLGGWNFGVNSILVEGFGTASGTAFTDTYLNDNYANVGSAYFFPFTTPSRYVYGNLSESYIQQLRVTINVSLYNNDYNYGLSQIKLFKENASPNIQDVLHNVDKYNNITAPASVNSTENVNFDANVEPTQTGNVPKSSQWLWQYFAQSINYFEKKALKNNNFNGISGENAIDADSINDDFFGYAYVGYGGTTNCGLLISYKDKKRYRNCQLFLSSEYSNDVGLLFRNYNTSTSTWGEWRRVTSSLDSSPEYLFWDGLNIFTFGKIDFTDNIYITYNGTVDGVANFINSTTFTTANRIHNIYLYLPANNKMIPKWPGCLSNIEITEALQNVMIKLEIKKINSKTLVNATILK